MKVGLYCRTNWRNVSISSMILQKTGAFLTNQTTGAMDPKCRWGRENIFRVRVPPAKSVTRTNSLARPTPDCWKHMRQAARQGSEGRNQPALILSSCQRCPMREKSMWRLSGSGGRLLAPVLRVGAVVSSSCSLQVAEQVAWQDSTSEQARGCLLWVLLVTQPVCLWPGN